MVRATAALLIAAAGLSAAAQDRLPMLPGYEQHQRMAPLIAGSWTSGAISPHWASDGRSFTYTLGGRAYRFDLATLRSSALALGPQRQLPGPRATGPDDTRQSPGPRATAQENAPQQEMPGDPIAGCPVAAIARGRQAFCELSPDGTHKAFVRDRNLWLANVDGSNETRLTTDGSEASRVKYGIASWVYGEELGQRTGIWWSPDSAKVAFYRFDESRVRDYYLAMNQAALQDTLDVEAYPKAGSPNPVPDVLVYDLTTRRTNRIDVRDGRPFDDVVLGHYVYNVRWRRDSTELLLNRANRRQQLVEFSACLASTGKCRRIVREESSTGWIDTEGAPSPRWLSDDRRFIWESSRNGWVNYYLYDLDGVLLAALTRNEFDAANILKVDEAAGVMFYAARDGDNFMKIQVHRVGLDGRGDVRLTDPAFSHSAVACRAGAPDPAAGAGADCPISPDNRFVVDVFQRHDRPPASQVLDAETGKVLARVADGDTTRMEALGFRPAELFTYKSADGATTLYGEISVPSNFDPAKKYPMLVPVYGGPNSFGDLPSESFVPPNPTAEYGFLIAKVTYRGVPGTGRRGADALYMKLGRTEIDDMAEGVKALWTRPYVDKTRVGIFGTSYGGYASLMAMLRYPDVFAAASSSSPVTDWRNYDTVYTERYMWTPQENAIGYDAGSAMTYAANLKGRLLLYYDTADNNVHPSNSLQLIRALQAAGKSFDLQVGPDLPHGALNADRMMEFFIAELVGR
jgi:dipeptidyl-peptidase-4